MKKPRLSSLALLFFVIILLEVSLRVVVYVSPKIALLLGENTPVTIFDEKFAYRPNPALPDHDSKGFRNAKVPNSVDILVLGDSQTYGLGVSSEETWPRQLDAITSNSVYNMSFGGYGPVHSLLMLDEALELKPKIVIEGLYSGNDLHDSFNIVYNHGKALYLKSSNDKLVQKINTIEGKSPIDLKPKRDADSRKQTSNFNLYGSLRALFARNSMLFRLQQKVRLEISEKKNGKKDFYAEALSEVQEYEQGELKTTFTSRYRSIALDTADPRMEEGFHIVLRALSIINEKVESKKAEFVILLIPTKEFVFAPFITNPPDAYRNLVELEVDFWMRVKDYCNKQKIKCLDTSPVLVAMLKKGEQPYPTSSDGHPNGIGYKAIANFIKLSLALP